MHAMFLAAFFAAVEADVKARAARREEAMKIATEFKNQGNAAFTAGNYAEAIRLYTEVDLVYNNKIDI